MKYKEKERLIEELADKILEDIDHLNIEYHWYDNRLTPIYYEDEDWVVDGCIEAIAEYIYEPATYYDPAETYLTGLDVKVDGYVLYKEEQIDSKLSSYLFNIIASYIRENYRDYE